MNQHSNRRISIFAVILMLVLTAVYWNHFDNAFHFDDIHTIVNNGYIKDIANLPLFFQDAKTTSSLPTNQAYRPMITSLNAVDHWIAGDLNPTVFHWHIYLEFLLLLALLYLLLSRVFERASGNGHRMVALLGTAFFAFHAATAETINYIIARSDGFSTLMVLLGMLLYTGNKGWKKQLGLVPFIFGCLAKPTTLMLPPLLFLYDLLLEQPSFFIKDEKAKTIPKVIESLKGTASYFFIGAGMYLFTRSMFSDTWSPSNVAVLDYVNTQPYIFWVYIKTFFVPINLTADTDLTLIKDYLSPKVLWGLFVILVLIVVAWATARRRKTLPISFGIMWFFVTLAPSSSFVPLAEVMNHHRTFFPYLGLVMALSWACFLVYERFASRKHLALAKGVAGLLVIVVLGLHAYGTYQRNEVWDNGASLWHDVTIKSPKNGRGLMNYGLTEMRIGNSETAIDYFERALDTNYGKHPYLYINLGVAKNALANRTNNQILKKEAEAYLKKAVQIGPKYPECHYYYGRWLSNNGKPTEAVRYLKKALELSPGHQPAQALLNSIGQTVEEALRSAEEWAVKQNTPEAFLDLSLKYYNNGQYENCIRVCNRAIELKPDYAEAYNNQCSAFNKLGLYEKAVAACVESLKLKPDYDLAKGNLDWAKSQLSKSQ